MTRPQLHWRLNGQKRVAHRRARRATFWRAVAGLWRRDGGVGAGIPPLMHHIACRPATHRSISLLPSALQIFVSPWPLFCPWPCLKGVSPPFALFLLHSCCSTENHLYLPPCISLHPLHWPKSEETSWKADVGEDILAPHPFPEACYFVALLSKHSMSDDKLYRDESCDSIPSISATKWTVGSQVGFQPRAVEVPPWRVPSACQASLHNQTHTRKSHVFLAKDLINWFFNEQKHGLGFWCFLKNKMMGKKKRGRKGRCCGTFKYSLKQDK